MYKVELKFEGEEMEVEVKVVTKDKEKLELIMREIGKVLAKEN